MNVLLKRLPAVLLIKTIVLGILFLLFISPIIAQNVFSYHNGQLRNYFMQLNKPIPELDYLYDMAIHSIDTSENSVFYDTIANDTMSARIWLRQYGETRNMAYDTVGFMTASVFSQKAYDTTTYDTTNAFGHEVTGKIPIALVHYGYYNFKPTVMSSADILNYFQVDTVNNSFTDIPGRPNEPYLRKTVFSAAALSFLIESPKQTFILDKEWFVIDNSNFKYYNNPQYQFKINFSDGQGNRYYDTDKRYEIEVDYSNYPGINIAKIEIVSLDSLGNENIVAGNYFRIRSPSSYSVPAGSTSTSLGLKIRTIEGCGADDPDRIRKKIVIVGGFDPLETRNTSDIYETVVRRTKIEKLLEYGYTIHVVDFADSKIDMRANATYLTYYLDQLKFELLDSGDPENPKSSEPMVIIGYSMGGVIANFALANWEQNPGVSNNYTDYLHYTRLLITMDSPHEGANIPMAYQYLYRNVESLYGMGFIDLTTRILNKQIGLGLLESQATKQLLMYHIDTRGFPTTNTYTMHPERQAFLNDLALLGGGPSHCKVMAVSGGSASGIRQLRDWDKNIRTPGDRLLHFDGFAYFRILWFKLPLVYAKLEMNTSNGSNLVYESFSNLNFFRFRLTWKGLKNKLQNTLSPYFGASANIHSYDVEAGSYDAGLGFGIEDFNNEVEWPRNLPLVNVSSSQNHIGGGEYVIDMEFGILGYGLGINANIESDGYGFNFVPLRSALSYGGNIYQGQQSPNIENSNATSFMAQTPFDAILGVSSQNPLEIDGILHYNYSHNWLLNPALKDLAYPNQTVRLRTCGDQANRPISYLLNREIGDEKLFLENFDMVFPKSNFFPEYDLFINERNPAYRYSSFINIPTRNRAAFSDDEPFLQYFSNTAEFYSDQTAALAFSPPDFSQGFIYNAPVTGIWNHTDKILAICCGNGNLRLKNIQSEVVNNDTWLGYDLGKHSVKLENFIDKTQSLNFQLFNMNGKKLQEGIWTYHENQVYTFNAPSSGGIYLLKVFSTQKQSLIKIFNP